MGSALACRGGGGGGMAPGLKPLCADAAVLFFATPVVVVVVAEEEEEEDEEEECDSAAGFLVSVVFLVGVFAATTSSSVLVGCVRLAGVVGVLVAGVLVVEEDGDGAALVAGVLIVVGDRHTHEKNRSHKLTREIYNILVHPQATHPKHHSFHHYQHVLGLDENLGLCNNNLGWRCVVLFLCHFRLHGSECRGVELLGHLWGVYTSSVTSNPPATTHTIPTHTCLRFLAQSPCIWIGCDLVICGEGKTDWGCKAIRHD